MGEQGIAGSKLSEYSIIAYIGAFIVLNAVNTAFLSPAAWSVYEPSNPEPVNESVLTDNNDPRISAFYWDEEGDGGTLKFYNSDGNQINSCSVTNGSRCGIEWGGASAHDNYWYAVAEDNTGETAAGPWWYFLINNQPNPAQLENPSDGAVIYDDEAKLSVQVSDPDGDSMSVEFLNNVSNASSSERTVTGISDGGTASVNLDVERGKHYRWWVVVSDDWNSTRSGSWSFYVNSLPQLEDVQPDDGSVHSNNGVILNASATDDEQTSITMYFFDENDNFLGKESGAEKELLSSDTWDELRLGETYKWYVNVSDGYGNRTYPEFSFIRSASEQYRVSQNIQYDYSSIIVPLDSSQVFTIKITNKISTSKSLNTYLEGVNAYFDSNGKKSISYTLAGYESKEFLVTVRPKSKSAEELKVITENPSIGINTTESIPVEVRSRDPVSETRNVPGIGLIQLLMLMLVSTAIYFGTY